MWGTAAHPTSRLLYLSQAVRVEWPHRTTRYGNMLSGCCGECSCPQCWQRGALSTLGGTDSVHPRLQQHWVKYLPGNNCNMNHFRQGGAQI
ncbi:hypothetical protein NQZ68_023197 [Dissostichus eleginoides]|nr:hypothetical protein NQZ68_023197 [Dissostichus eleginoides]